MCIRKNVQAMHFIREGLEIQREICSQSREKEYVMIWSQK